MLQTKNLVKVYKTKKGVSVKALDNISIAFPEKGMVFLLGRSGSGKSTLLNLLGGLDDYSSGEIIINGVSSKYFRSKHFDSYRNTYVGFIFQEYHVLEELTVGANIALAIELQGRKATDEEINEILKEVDLEGFAKRKPNELSGGQKQRVAIARALVKQPKIIMADEPTGALDSNTGKQILATLKKLSKEKLVIIVSHDREFAESYADRIVELADGVVIRDVECNSDEPEEEGLAYQGANIEVPLGYQLTEDDRELINQYIAKIKSGKINLEISTERVVGRKFLPTDHSKIELKDGSSFKLIRSKLPFKDSLKMGLRALTHKKFRLALTILLSCISFALCGFVDTFGGYTDAKCRTNTLYDNGYSFVAVTKTKKLQSGDKYDWFENDNYLSEDDFDAIKKESGVKMHGVYVLKDKSLSFSGNVFYSQGRTETDYDLYKEEFFGIAEIDEKVIDELGFKLIAGKYPDGKKDEIVVSDYVFEIFKAGNYTNDQIYYFTDSGEKKPDSRSVTKPELLLDKVITVGDKNYTICGVVDTKFDMERYQPLTKHDENITDSEKTELDALKNEFGTVLDYSFARVMMVGEGYVESLLGKKEIIQEPRNGEFSVNSSPRPYFTVQDPFLCNDDYLDFSAVHWVDEPKTKLGKMDIIVTRDALVDTLWDAPQETAAFAKFLSGKNSCCVWKNFLGDNSDEMEQETGYNIVGILEPTDKIYKSVICHDDLYYQFIDKGNNVYTYAVGKMPESRDGIETLVNYCYRDGTDTQYWIRNAATWNLDQVNEQLQDYSKTFLYLGVFIAIFAAMMLANFISSSITNQREEIGILRAIGARGKDVFSIFFIESFIIAAINFIISTAIVAFFTGFVSDTLINDTGFMLSILNFGFRQVILLFLISMLVAFGASYVPVKTVASMKPIDAIRNK